MTYLPVQLAGDIFRLFGIVDAPTLRPLLLKGRKMPGLSRRCKLSPVAWLGLAGLQRAGLGTRAVAHTVRERVEGFSLKERGGVRDEERLGLAGFVFQIERACSTPAD